MNYVFKKIVMIFILVSTLSCEKLANSMFSDKDDVSMGKNLHDEIKSKPNEFKILENEELRNYVQSIIFTILKSNSIKKKNIYPYKVTLLQDDKTINAFCTPGGYIYVYTGLLKFLDNEATLAAVLAHEIAHAEKRHVRQRIISSMSIQIGFLLLAIFNSKVDFSGLNFFGDLAILSNSRGDEEEADEFGFIYLKSTPYYQGAMSYFFDKLNSLEKNGKGIKSLEKLFSTHPLADERLKANQKRILKNKINKPSPNNLFEVKYKNTINKFLKASTINENEVLDENNEP